MVMAADCSNTLADTQSNATQACRRPSLYASMRLARLIHRVKERLRARTQQYALPEEDTYLLKNSLEAQAQRDWHYGSARGLAHPTPLNVKQSQVDVPRLLGKLDQHLPASPHKTLTVAAQDQLFLTYNAQAFVRLKSVEELRRIYDLVSLLLARLPAVSTSVAGNVWPSTASVASAGGVCDEKAAANLDHILRCLRQAALDALIHQGLQALEEDVQQWRRNWLQERQSSLGWFSEWPSGRRPLSTTWPWNIKPSLVILWGVCWMFYDNSTQSAQELRQQLGDDEVAAPVWARHTPQPATSSQENIARWTTGNSDPSFQNPAWLQSGGSGGVNARHAIRTPEYTTTLPGYQSSHPIFQGPYISSYPVVSSDAVSDPSIAWQQNQGSYSLPRHLGNSSPQTAPSAHRHSAPSSIATFSPDYNIWQLPFVHQPQQGQQQPQRSEPYPPRTFPTTEDQPYAVFPQQAISQRDLSAAAVLSSSLQLPVGHMQHYPSPHSDVSKDETRSSTFSFLPSTEVSPNMRLAASPSVQSPPSPAGAGKKGEEPPRNAQGQIVCNHPQCANDPPVFSRRCEWTKHVDKHTRPYVCNLPGCEKIRGFTYSGGLSRHQREVHRQFGGPKAAYMCPHNDCKRSTGSGFSRRENLQEHLRRVHRHVGEAEVDKPPTTQATSSGITGSRRRRNCPNDDDGDGDEGDDGEETPVVLPEPRKRRRVVEEEKETTSQDSSSKEDLSAQVKRLRREIREKDERLRKLEQTVELLMKRFS